MKLLIATRNPGKFAEIRNLLANLPITTVGLSDVGIPDDVAESGATFSENARLKAEYYSGLSGIPTLADDSGLEIDCLAGAPGVRSARWAGENASDSERIQKVLSSMVTSGRRTARFVCVAAFADNLTKTTSSAVGICEGEIAEVPRGSNGFGYDPIFIPHGSRLTLAELSPAEKAALSHRTIAIFKIIPFLRGFFDI